MVEKVTYSRRDLLSIAALTASLNVDGHRADLVILKAARAHAAYEGRTAITDRDIALAAELALPTVSNTAPSTRPGSRPNNCRNASNNCRDHLPMGNPPKPPRKTRMRRK